MAKATGQGAGDWAQDLRKDQSLHCALRIPSASGAQSPPENREGRKNGKGNRKREREKQQGWPTWREEPETRGRGEKRERGGRHRQRELARYFPRGLRVGWVDQWFPRGLSVRISHSVLSERKRRRKMNGNSLGVPKSPCCLSLSTRPGLPDGRQRGPFSGHCYP